MYINPFYVRPDRKSRYFVVCAVYALFGGTGIFPYGLCPSKAKRTFPRRLWTLRSTTHGLTLTPRRQRHYHDGVTAQMCCGESLVL